MPKNAIAGAATTTALICHRSIFMAASLVPAPQRHIPRSAALARGRHGLATGITSPLSLTRSHRRESSRGAAWAGPRSLAYERERDLMHARRIGDPGGPGTEGQTLLDTGAGERRRDLVRGRIDPHEESGPDRAVVERDASPLPPRGLARDRGSDSVR